MHVLAFSGRTLPGRLEEGVAIFNKEIIGKLRENEHYREVHLMTNRDGRFLVHFHANGECGPGVLKQLHDEVRHRMEHVIQGHMRFRQWDIAAADRATERGPSAN